MNRRCALKLIGAAAIWRSRAAPSYAAQLAQAGEGASPEERTLASLPRYTPRQRVNGTVRLWGHGAPKLDFMGALVRAWEMGFQTFQPGVRIEYDMYGTASAMGALYSGAGDIAILGQEIYDFEVRAFERVRRYPPLQVMIATGSADVRNFDFAIVVFLHETNPIGKLTLDELDRIFAWQRIPARNVTRWGQLGLTGEWANRAIHLYGWRSDDVFSTFLQNRVLHGSHEWRCEVQEFAHIHRPDGSVYDSGQQILDHLAGDPEGIAFSNYRYQRPGVKPVAIAWKAEGPYWRATKETLIRREYPLGRMIPAVIDRAPGKAIAPQLREFLLYLLSRDGQQQIVNNGKYLPINAGVAAAGRERLA